VSGVRTPRDLAELREAMPEAYDQLIEILRTLEAHYKDMQDTEFTVERGRLYMLQTRSAKRPAQAAVRFAVDAVNEGLLTREEAIRTIDADALDALLHPTFGRGADYQVLARGVAASPGAAKGEIVFTADSAVEAAESGRQVVLMRPFTEADDVAGFFAARGIVTSEGGKASHAALVARGMGRPAVCGVGELEIDLLAREVRVAGRPVKLGPLEYRLVEYLGRNAGVAVSRDQILNEVYGIAASIGTERVDLLVRRLRLKLGDYPDMGGHIVAHPGYGYLLERRAPDR